MRHFCAEKACLNIIVERSRADDLAAMDLFSELLRNGGHTVGLITSTGAEMKDKTYKAAQFSFR